jgi:hypothetical protein
MPAKKRGSPANTPKSTIDDLDAAGTHSLLIEQRTADSTDPANPAGGGTAAPIWRIYHLRRLTDSAGYVGVTQRPLAIRLAAHGTIARRHPERGRPGSLAAAIRQTFADGLPFQTAFQAEILAETSLPAEARRLERVWINRLGTASPRGFNVMPGGASLGGPANAIPLTLAHPTRGFLRFASLMDAVTATDRERQREAKPPLQLGTIYARRELGWSIEEALELTTHVDGRRRRAAFRWRGRSYRTLEEVAQVDGVAIATIRSRLHRARRAGCEVWHDAAKDRRLPGSHRTGDAKCGRQKPLALPHPADPKSAPVDAASFARMSGLPRATVLHRHHRLLETHGSAVLPRAIVLAALVARQDRRVVLSLSLPGGQTLRDGVRALIRTVLSDPALNGSRAEKLGFSAIRARLRRVPGWPADLSVDAVQWAFGFSHTAEPAVVVPIAMPPNVSRDAASPPMSVTAWRRWPSEQLWLWFDPTSSAVRHRMRAVLADALGSLPEADTERLSTLADRDDPGTALRLLARLLGQEADSCQQARDLSACALLLATLEYGDARAATEFALFAHRCADPAAAAGHGFGRYPKPLDQRRVLQERMQRQAGLALSRVRSTSGSMFLDSEAMSSGDPLANLDASVQMQRRRRI